MFRNFIIVLVGVAGLGSTPAAFAQERDGDGNPVPGVSMQQTGGWERAFAGPARGADSAQLALAERLSRVH